MNVAIENMATAIRLDSNVHNNSFYDIRIHSKDTYETISDSSGGANRFYGISGGENLSYPTMHPQPLNPTNLIVNGEMERWEASTSAAPTGWKTAGFDGESVARENNMVHKGEYSCKLSSAVQNALIHQKLHPYLHLRGGYVAAAAWVYADYALSATEVVRLAVSDDGGLSYSRPHSGVAGWELLSVRRKLVSDATYIGLQLQIIGLKTDAYFDQVIMVEGTEVPLPSDTPLLDSKRLYATVNWNPEKLDQRQLFLPSGDS